ncbi:uncharacterized protein LOC131662164 [Vicia villosa]|uniref:uncharacterized protein LOC131662164 n=1 Tax=Vicia villosa TaxID=3911 RepID=UPI00273AFD22|nr:uncharacterized protein LOC131662164 [Vicia villosa]XP_058787852.1 uncharacterized protein LOC131662164 [Vicia villosa]XP_058787853.1 uncharacterized protein LOC131662164 [Vicia villosa]XP_058787854.1 uncharacterized protein LOC131662164 [Vicia villosa]
MKTMDKDISNWVMEFLLRSSVPDSLIHKTLTVLPLSGADSRLKKTLLLRTLQTHLRTASLSETSLQIIESLEELYRRDEIRVSAAMRSAYCAVAVECTVKYLITSHEDPSGEYFSAVRRIWRGRVVQLSAEGQRSELLSEELSRWGEDIEAALWDVRASERLAGLNTRRDAMNEVHRFLKDAWQVMGPSFLDSMAMVSKGNGLRPEGVCGNASGSEKLKKSDGRLDSLGKEKMCSVVDDNNDNDNVDDGGDDDDDVAVMGENHGNERLEERVGTSVDANQEVGGCDSSNVDKEIWEGNVRLKRKHSALRTCHRGVKISGAEEVRPTNLSSKYKILPSPEVEKVRESLKSSSMELKALVKDPLPDALRSSEDVRSKLATKHINLGPPSENQSGPVDVRRSDGCKTIVLYQAKANDANLSKKSSVPCSNDRRPNFMGRASSAHTYEWDDSIDNSLQARQPRRKKRKWTSLEEETLRAGVKMFGEGNWRTIRDFYSNIFEYRSGVDLKDKWRNMMR